MRSRTSRPKAKKRRRNSTLLRPYTIARTKAEAETKEGTKDKTGKVTPLEVVQIILAVIYTMLMLALFIWSGVLR